MRQDTPIGPIWIVPDFMSEKVAKQAARLDLMWPDLEGFVAMHTGPKNGGVWIVRAPRAALEAREYPVTAAAELPVKEGTCWPPISEEGQKIIQDFENAS
jgi:hypothetical protein